MTPETKGEIQFFAFLAAVVAIIWFIGWGRHMAWRYQLQYNAAAEYVTVEKKPHDCDFWTAPVGRKHCDYKKRASIEKWRLVAGKAEHSKDGGRTWEPASFNNPDRISVWIYVTWEKVED